MKGIICYYSGSGNTKLAAEYLSQKLICVDFELMDIVKNNIFDLHNYDIAGFAAFTDFGSVPQLFYTFMNRLQPHPDKHAFVLNTYGCLSGRTLKDLVNLAELKQFIVVSGHSLHTPESYPPMRVRNKTFDDSPNSKELNDFNQFIYKLDHMISIIKSGQKTKFEKIKYGLLGTLTPKLSRRHAKNDFGKQRVDENLCIQCGLCKKLCPYQAILLNPYPFFHHHYCYGCWTCYNHCPQKAIYTKKYNGKGQYPKPSPELKKKLTIH